MTSDPKNAVRIGTRINGGRLAEQARTTLELASRHLQDLTVFGITKARLGEYRGLLARVQKGAGDRTVNRQEAALATEKQNRTFLQAKDWLRKLLTIADNAFVDSPTVNRAFNTGAKIGLSLPRLVSAINERLELAHSHAADLAEWGGTTAFIKEGERLLAELQETDGRQEAAVKALPKSTLDFYRAKGELMIAIKRVNRAAKVAFLEDRALRSKFNLDVLYRNVSNRKPVVVESAAATGGL